MSRQESQGPTDDLQRLVQERTAELEAAHRELGEIKERFEAVYNHHYQLTGLLDTQGNRHHRRLVEDHVAPGHRIAQHFQVEYRRGAEIHIDRIETGQFRNAYTSGVQCFQNGAVAQAQHTPGANGIQ